MNSSAIQPVSAPWWRHPMVWLVIAGPAVVVVAGFYTLWLAVRAPDPVLTPDYYREGLEINRSLEKRTDRDLMPAMTGRNHAATPSRDVPAPRH